VAGIPVLLSPPSLLDVGTWEGAMVSSTSRLATPIDKFLYSTEQVSRPPTHHRKSRINVFHCFMDAIVRVLV
jgi:hypothetical protein